MAASSASPTLLKRPEDRLAAFLALTAPVLMVLPFVVSRHVSVPGWYFVLYWPVFWFVVSRNNYILHNHCHNAMSRHRWLNRLFEICLSVVTGMSAGTWRLSHNHGHHVAHKRQHLPHHWFPFVEEGEPLLQRYSFGNALRFSAKTTPIQWFGILDVALVRWLKGGFRAPYYRYLFFEALGIWAVVALLAVIDWRLCLGFVLLPHLLAHFFSRYVDYLFHVCADPGVNYRYCFNCVNPSFNRWCWNTGYHLAHHNRPRLHWSDLPKHHKELMKAHPEIKQQNLEYNYSGLFIFLHHFKEKRHPRPVLYPSPAGV